MRTKKSKLSDKKLASTNSADTQMGDQKITGKLKVSPPIARNKKSKLSNEQLASIIGTDARLSAEKLAKKLKVSPTTVRRHLKIATREGVMRTVAMVDPDKAGLTVQAVIGLNVSRDNLDSTIITLEKQSEIKWLATVTGKYDILAKTAFPSTRELSVFLSETLGKIKGVTNSESLVCLDIPKGRFIPLD